MRLILSLFLLVVATSVVLVACKKRDQPAPNPLIKTFTFTTAQNTGLTQDIAGIISADTIKVTLPRGIDLKRLVPTITYVGTQVSPASGTPVDFSAPVRYTVAGHDGGSHSYWVVVQYLSSDKQITSFQL